MYDEEGWGIDVWGSVACIYVGSLGYCNALNSKAVVSSRYQSYKMYASLALSLSLAYNTDLLCSIPLCSDNCFSFVPIITFHLVMTLLMGA